MKRHPLIISNRFPAHHPRKGQFTLFEEHIRNGVKVHTIRRNLDHWLGVERSVRAREGNLYVRRWSGRPYHSPQQDIAILQRMRVHRIDIDWTREVRFDPDPELVVQISGPVQVTPTDLTFGRRYLSEPDPVERIWGPAVFPTPYAVARHDGLELQDLQGWFPEGIQRGALIVFGNYCYDDESDGLVGPGDEFIP